MDEQHPKVLSGHSRCRFEHDRMGYRVVWNPQNIGRKSLSAPAEDYMEGTVMHTAAPTYEHIEIDTGRYARVRYGVAPHAEAVLPSQSIHPVASCIGGNCA